VSVERIRDFLRMVELAAAERQAPTPHGLGLFADSLPSVYDVNYLSVAEPRGIDPATLAAEAEHVMEPFLHRRLILERSDDTVANGLAGLGFERSTHIVFAHAREPDRHVDASMVREVEFERLAPARAASMAEESWCDADVAAQLNAAKRLVQRAVSVRFFAVFEDDRLTAYCELRSDGRIAQIEDVVVRPAYRGRGLGRAIVQHALDEARLAHEIVFLEALADDWPRHLYTKLGFDPVDRRDVLTKLPHPLTRLRLRTPRLELRLATVRELRQLYEVAAAGIHDPAFMPFEVAWTDDLEEEAFLAYHRSRVTDAGPNEWELALVAFHDRRPIGVQSIHGRDFGATRVAATGSWLGRAWQGRGLGTELRTAALTFCFDFLGADRAKSGAIDGNEASAGVSRKLGYEHVGTSTVRPRGTPVAHADLELARARFRPAVRVEITGFSPELLPWFGVRA
jgi:RimJ/RimL family protein N-acetyltransferase